MIAYVMMYRGQRVYAIEIGRKQWHQVIMILQSDVGPMKYGSKVLLNLNTKELTTLNEREEYDQAS